MMCTTIEAHFQVRYIFGKSCALCGPAQNVSVAEVSINVGLDLVLSGVHGRHLVA